MNEGDEELDRQSLMVADANWGYVPLAGHPADVGRLESVHRVEREAGDVGD